MRATARTFLIFIAFNLPVFGQPIGSEDLFVRVVDVGAGLCCVVKMPGNYYMVYDAGRGSTRPVNGILEVIPEDEEIDLLILSHSDSDHLGAVKKLCDKYRIKRAFRTCFKQPDEETWVQVDKALRWEVIEDGCRDTNLRDFRVRHVHSEFCRTSEQNSE